MHCFLLLRCSLLLFKTAGTGGAAFNTRLEANSLEDQLRQLDGEIRAVKAAYDTAKKKGEGSQLRRKLRAKHNTLVARSNDLHAQLQQLEPKRLADRQKAKSGLAALFFG